MPSVDRQVPLYRRIRILSCWLLVQTTLILALFGLVIGNVIVFVGVGALTGFCAGLVTCLVYLSNRESMDKAGWRW